MCFCKIERLDHEEELEVPIRPRRQASQRLSPSSQFNGGHSLSTLPPRLEPLGAVQLYSRPRQAELRRSVSQDRVVLVEIITPRSSGLAVLQRPCPVGEGPLPKELQTETRPPSIAKLDGQLEPHLIRPKSSPQSNDTVAVITPR